LRKKRQNLPGFKRKLVPNENKLHQKINGLQAQPHMACGSHGNFRQKAEIRLGNQGLAAL
jgi:hypothetical protein